MLRRGDLGGGGRVRAVGETLFLTEISCFVTGRCGQLAWQGGAGDGPLFSECGGY